MLEECHDSTIWHEDAVVRELQLPAYQLRLRPVESKVLLGAFGHTGNVAILRSVFSKMIRKVTCKLVELSLRRLYGGKRSGVPALADFGSQGVSHGDEGQEAFSASRLVDVPCEGRPVLCGLSMIRHLLNDTCHLQLLAETKTR